MNGMALTRIGAENRKLTPYLPRCHSYLQPNPTKPIRHVIIKRERERVTTCIVINILQIFFISDTKLDVFLFFFIYFFKFIDL